MGDYDLKTVDFETYLVGPVTDRIIDADRQVWMEWRNGFPNWALYRTCYAGDAHLRIPLRSFCVAYAIAYAEAGGVRKGQPVDEIGCLAGWDAFYRLIHTQWLIAGKDVADVAGVDPKTYRKVRNYVYASLRASLDEYWMRLQIAVRQVALREKWQHQEMVRGRLSAGRGFDPSEDLSGTGNFRAIPRGSGW
jgi:hypothetical protein